MRTVRLVSAILWIEPESFGVARVAYRLAKRIDREVSFSFFDGQGGFAPGIHFDPPTLGGEEGLAADSSVGDEAGPDERPGTPGGRLSSLFDGFNGIYAAISPPVAMDIRAVVVDYQLRDLRHWLPRAVRWEGTVGLAEDVLPDGQPVTPFPFRMDWAFEIEEIREAGAAGARTVAEVVESWREVGDRVGEIEGAGPDDVVVLAPASRSALLSSEELPPPMREGGIGAPGDATVDALAVELAGIAPEGDKTADAAALESNPWRFEPPGQSLRLMRYNDVEGLSVGTRLARGFGRSWANLTIRAGTKSPEFPDLLFTLSRGFGGVRAVGRVYRSLGIPDVGTPWVPFASANQFVRDAPLADYSWSHGAGLLLLPADGRRNWISLETFAMRETELDGADRFDRYGGELKLRPWWGGRRRTVGRSPEAGLVDARGNGTLATGS